MKIVKMVNGTIGSSFDTLSQLVTTISSFDYSGKAGRPVVLLLAHIVLTEFVSSVFVCFCVCVALCALFNFSVVLQVVKLHISASHDKFVQIAEKMELKKMSRDRDEGMRLFSKAGLKQQIFDGSGTI